MKITREEQTENARCAALYIALRLSESPWHHNEEWAVIRDRNDENRYNVELVSELSANDFVRVWAIVANGRTVA